MIIRALVTEALILLFQSESGCSISSAILARRTRSPAPICANLRKSGGRTGYLTRPHV